VDSSSLSAYFWRMFCQWQERIDKSGVRIMDMQVASMDNMLDFRPVNKSNRVSDHTFLTLNGVLTSVISGMMIVLLFAQCATPVAPKGGPKDLTPPGVVVEESTQNPMINFDIEEIHITLDEWVQLKNAATQMVISPPIEPRPFPKLDRKTVIIPIDLESIQDNTTYTINFGESIQDITERNPLLNHTFVFSKGSYVDSLSMNGVVINALTGEPEAGARFILHDNTSDTAISTVLPSYFSTTDEEGRFQLKYLRADTFRAYAIKEAEFGNYRYNDSEQLGFLSEPVILKDTVPVEVSIWIYYPLLPIKVISAHRDQEAWKIALSREASLIGIGGDTASIIFWDQTADTIKLWHISPDTLDIEILVAGDPFDTVSIEPFVQIDASLSISLISKKQHPDNNVQFTAERPVASINSTFIQVAQGDTLALAAFEMAIGKEDPRKFYLKAKWVEKGKYHVRLLPGAVTDIFGNINDTLQFVVSFDERVNYGLLNLTMMGFDSTISYVFELFDRETEVESRIVTNETGRVLIFNRLPARDYVAKIIEDRNGNGVWDAGDLETKRQPERIFMQKIEGMRPGWDLDLTITWPEK